MFYAPTGAAWAILSEKCAVPTGLVHFSYAYPGLNHPNTRKNGARWGPRYALG
jgi:hypothetical protein